MMMIRTTSTTTTTLTRQGRDDVTLDLTRTKRRRRRGGGGGRGGGRECTGKNFHSYSRMQPGDRLPTSYCDEQRRKNRRYLQKKPPRRRTDFRMIVSAMLMLYLIVRHDCEASSSSKFFRPFKRKTRLTWVNGIGYNMQHMIEGQQEISILFAKHVEFCHNPTSMSTEDDLVGYLGDLTQAGTQKLGRVTKEVNLLVKHLKEAVLSVGKGGKVIHIAHSQGALVTALAAQKLTVEEMNQIEIIAFGGAAALRKTAVTPFARCINYYSVNDPLLWVAPSAEQALRSGLVPQEPEFCFLVPRIGDPIADHQLLGPTYRQALIWEGNRYKQVYQSPMERTIYWLVALCAAIYQYLRELLPILMERTIRLFLALCISIYQHSRDTLQFTTEKATYWFIAFCIMIYQYSQAPFASIGSNFYQLVVSRRIETNEDTLEEYERL